ncbi:translation factor SUA5 [Sphaerotilus hippei]|uniref:Threonylcarbamoyl-AMP synthase n=1 Tax=Sphaerotilus hippei TaxID=744406 RepID=A0A318GZV8_9BURK|nr:L-threonylcarbamoyladenylate synthase [Sphaerotilus hippei]PXW95878.1 translation factor SUA5 [Sphaerotilus hippei]
MARVTPASSPADQAAALPAAVDALVRGELLAFPTETVYGLGARADDAAAVARIFAAKGRPSDHPLIVHVADAAGAEAFAAELPPSARRLMAAFWPGPLTVIVPRREGIGAEAAGGQDSVGLRCPSHPLALALLRAAAAAGVPGVAAPSANRFGRVSPTRAAHVADEFTALPGLIVLDGGDCAVGIESAIIDCTREPAVLLRPGALSAAHIEAVLQAPLGQRDGHSPRASGTLAAHYAPSATVRLMDTDTLRAALQSSAAATRPGDPVAVYCRSVLPAGAPGMLHRVMPSDPDAVAHELFGVLRDLDAARVGQIWVEQPPADPVWDGVRDRLQRAAAAAPDA